MWLDSTGVLQQSVCSTVMSRNMMLTLDQCHMDAFRYLCIGLELIDESKTLDGEI